MTNKQAIIVAICLLLMVGCGMFLFVLGFVFHDWPDVLLGGILWAGIPASYLLFHKKLPPQDKGSKE